MRKCNWRTLGGIGALCMCFILLVTSDFMNAFDSLYGDPLATKNDLEYSLQSDLPTRNRTGTISDISPSRTLSSASYFNLLSKKERVLYKHTFNPIDACDSKPSILIFVFSSPQKFMNRMVIRRTWGSKYILKRNNAKLLFIIGQPEPEFNWVDSKSIQREQNINKDIVQSTFVDTYKNLTMKSISVIEWMLDFCDKSKYMVKVDEDVILNVDRLQEILEHNKCSNCLLGQVISGASPVRDRRAKWYTSPGIYRDAIYPDYLSGTAYVIPTALLPELYHVILDTKRFWLEDIYITGICASKAGGTLVDNGYFNGIMTRKTPVCDYRLVTSHGFTNRQMELCWASLKRKMRNTRPSEKK